jgi:hypothetical protein
MLLLLVVGVIACLMHMPWCETPSRSTSMQMLQTLNEPPLLQTINHPLPRHMLQTTRPSLPLLDTLQAILCLFHFTLAPIEIHTHL